MPQITISVRDFIALHYGPRHIARVSTHPARLQQGNQGHIEATARRPAHYRREVPVDYRYSEGEWQLHIRGRIDGLLDTGDYLLVEEIKTTYLDDPEQLLPECNQFYTAQLTLYAWFVSQDNPGRDVRGRLTWWHLEQKKEMALDFSSQDVAGGELLFAQLAAELIAREKERHRWLNRRNQSLARLEFPFPSFRPGQGELMHTCAAALEQNQDLMVEAATGIGKTAALLVPALQWLAGAPPNAKVFFLTAKNSARAIVLETLQRLPGLELRSVFIEAKERSCPHPEQNCEECPLGLDFYPRAKKLLPRLLRHKLLPAELIHELALANGLCPFELNLEAASYADLVVGDYNYAFDPMVQLNRFFGPGKQIPAALLVDEAHNLVSRGRDMFSADLGKKEVLQLQRELKHAWPQLAEKFRELNRIFIQWNKELKAQGGGVLLPGALPRGMKAKLLRLAEELSQFADPPSLLQDFSRRLVKFNKVLRLMDKAHTILICRRGGDTQVMLFCLNPGPLLAKQRAKCIAVFFSATLSPGKYYRELLGCREQYLDVALPSPFPRENRLFVHIPGVKTTYGARDEYYLPVARYIARVVAIKPGNYIAYFPSYTYLEQVAACLQSCLPQEFNLHRQQPQMSPQERAQLLQQLSAQGANLGLAVTGGIFGEGVDLPGDKLIGTIIVGPGLPMVSPSRQLIREYFDQRDHSGFLYAYAVPGMLRVIQSAGRVFRTPEDRGIVVLLDDRFRSEGYRQLLPEYWREEGLFANGWLQRIREFWQQ